jgi:hypothetical protein
VTKEVVIKVLDCSDINFTALNKHNNEVRSNFLKNLKTKGLLSNPKQREQNSKKIFGLKILVIIFDWDDTLLCTTFLSRLNGIIETKWREKEKMILNRIDQTASALLTRACDYGEPFIITNAARGWVEYSSKLFMPTVHQVLIDKQIKILSARSAYENKFPGDAKRWKMEAFQEIAKSYDKHVRVFGFNCKNRL